MSNIEEDVKDLKKILREGNSLNKRKNKEIKFELNSNLHKIIQYIVQDRERLIKENEEKDARIQGAVKLINNIIDSCNGANLGDLQLILDILEDKE